MDLNVVGRSIKRIDGIGKVLGATQYGGDLRFPGMLYGKTLRSPFPHARVLKIDPTRAEMLAGVVAVVTARDIPGERRYGLVVRDQPVLVGEGDKVRMLGDPLALVAAVSEEAAAEALELIEVEYERLTVVSDPERALDADAPRVHEGSEGNLCASTRISKGDVEIGLAESDVVIEQVYFTPRQEAAPMEPDGGVAVPDGQGRITVYTGSQYPASMRVAIAQMLGLPEGKVRVVATATGGAFGSRTDAGLPMHAALLAAKTKEPVRMVWSREEAMLAHGKRHPARIRYRMGATREGKLTAIDVDILCDGGPYTERSPRILGTMVNSLPGPYSIPSFRVNGRVAFTNNPISGAVRGFGAPQGVAATECQMDLLARKLGMDPVAIRLRNALQQGMTPASASVVLDSRVSLPETIAQAVEAMGPLEKSSGPRKKTGRGIACAMPMFDVSGRPDYTGYKGTGAMVELLPDGSALLHTGVCEVGSGATTILAQIVAEELGLETEDVTVLFGDTDATPRAGNTGASRCAYTSGNAVREAAVKVKARILARAAEMLEVPPEILKLRSRRIYVEEAPERGLPVAEVATACCREGISLIGETLFVSTHAVMGHTFMTTIADVEVDQETGQAKVLKMVNAHDAGKALNPQNVRGQLLGGGLYGLGYVLWEEMATRDGFVLTPALSEYLLPTIRDTPERSLAVIVEDPYPTGPYGAKGVGEHTMSTVGPAILNAIHDALGARVFLFPATPERVLTALSSEIPGHPP